MRRAFNMVKRRNAAWADTRKRSKSSPECVRWMQKRQRNFYAPVMAGKVLATLATREDPGRSEDLVGVEDLQKNPPAQVPQRLQ